MLVHQRVHSLSSQPHPSPVLHQPYLGPLRRPSHGARLALAVQRLQRLGGVVATNLCDATALQNGPTEPGETHMGLSENVEKTPKPNGFNDHYPY